MICEFKSCTVPFKELSTGTCFAFPSSPQELYLKTETIWDDEGDCYNTVRLANGGLTSLSNDTPVIPYLMAKVIV